MMTAKVQPQDHLSDYERAVCYHSLPRTANPLTLGLVVAYALCLLEALAAIGVGIFIENNIWLKAGFYSFVGLIVFGLAVFTIRGFLSELRGRRDLAAAHGVPDARDSAQDFPDPFASHLLLRHPSYARDTVECLTGRQATHGYSVETAPSHKWWTITDVRTGEAIQVRVVTGARSFRIGGVLPSVAKVFRGEEEVARLKRPLSLNDLEAVIAVNQPVQRTFELRGRGFFVDNRLVGRVYTLRGACYLDIDRHFFNDGILAYFVTMT